jgi:hypothetical protein
MTAAKASCRCTFAANVKSCMSRNIRWQAIIPENYRQWSWHRRWSQEELARDHDARSLSDSRPKEMIGRRVRPLFILPPDVQLAINAGNTPGVGHNSDGPMSRPR